MLIGVNLPFEDAKDSLRIQLGTTNPEVPGMAVLIFEITYIFSKAGEISFENVLQRIDSAHKHVEDAFESCLTDELKQTFGEVEE